MYNFSWQLRAFCAAGFALFLSCSPETSVEPVCLGGDCTAIIKPIVESSTYSFDIDEDNSKIQYFTIEVHASATSHEWRYNGVPVVSAYWSGDLTYYVRTPYTFDEINSADRETFGSLHGDKVVITQIIGVRPDQSGKTLNLQVDVWWEAGENTMNRKYFQKIILK